jgi:GNAT superfamily N-acetyltransferase
VAAEADACAPTRLASAALPAPTIFPPLACHEVRQERVVQRLPACRARQKRERYCCQIGPLDRLVTTDPCWPTPIPRRFDVEQLLGRGDHQPVEVEGEPVGYGRVLWWVERDGTRVYLHLGKVVPAWRGRGIGTAILGWAERRARQLAAALPAAGRHELAANASETEVEATALLRDAGYRVPFTMLQMGLELAERLAEPPLPSGVGVRPALLGDYRAISSSVDEAYRASRGEGHFSMATDRAFILYESVGFHRLKRFPRYRKAP